MDFFNDDPFESIVREFFGENSHKSQRRNFIAGEDEERTIDFVESNKKVFIVFELPGYSKEDIDLIVSKGVIEINARKKNFENMQGYLSQKLGHGVRFKKTLPKFVNIKKFKSTFKNGILEVVFEKK